MSKRFGALAAALVCAAGTVRATDYYVGGENASDGNDGSFEAPFETIDKAVITATSSDDVIHVAAGTYQTGYPDYVAQTENAKWGPNLKAKLIGEGTTRGDVVLESHGEYRTLRMAAGSWLENVTIVGCTDISKADKGGAIEMSGGTVTNCVIRDGKAYASSNQAGGNLYMNSDAALVVDCLISGGVGKSHGGNVCLVKGTIRASTITKGTTYNEGEKYGANIYMSGGRVDTCTISEGDGYEGGEIYQTGGMVTNCTILANGVTRGSGGGVYMTGGTVDDCYIDGEGGTMSWHGGCIYMKNGTVRNTVCTNGVCRAAGTRDGGNIYMENGTLENVTLADGQCAQDGGNLRMTGGTVTGLVCTGGVAGRSGGNICAQGSAKVSTATISGGTAVNVGGNLYAYGSVTVGGCEISGGVSKADGGNIRIGDSVVVSDSTISGGTIVTDAEKKGANVYMDGSAKLIRCHMSGGTSFKADGETIGYNGGSVCSYSSSAVMEDCLVAGSARGGILLGSSVSMYNCSVVANEKYGIWGWSASKTSKLVNCVFFGNQNNGANADWTGDRPTLASGAVFDNCAATSESATLSTETYSTLVLISSTDFADYANGDYRPAAEGKLVDAGALDERTDASTKDLDGNPRLSDGIDIGCYEYQHTDMTVSFTAPALDVGYAPATASFTASAENAPGDVSYDVNFGDGTLATYTESQISHVYTASGTYTISVTAVSGVERSKPMTRTVKIVDKVQRVGEGGHATIQAAVDESVDGCEVILAAGTYEVTDPVVVNKAVTVRPDGAVIVRNTTAATSGSTNHRVMEISGGALVTGLVIENGSVFNGYGGCIDITAATVSNCVIRGGTATRGDTGNVGGAGVSLRSNAVLTHCYVTNNVVTGTSTGSGENAGGAVFIHNGNKPVSILNTLVAGNRYVCSEGVSPKSGSAGILFGGANENSLVENCTIVANTVEGALSNDSAGLHCTSWSAKFRNNVIAGNFETAKGEGGKYTSAKIDTTNCTVTYCVTDDAEPLKATCSVATRDEMFKNFDKGDYRPKAKGSLFNTGTTPSVSVAVDLAGGERVMFGAIDVGCYECQLKPGFSVVIR